MSTGADRAEGWGSIVRAVVGISAALSLTWGGGRRAEAQCMAPYFSWPGNAITTTTGPASAPSNDTAFNPNGKTYSYLVQGIHLLAIRNLDDGVGGPGTIKWDWIDPNMTTIQNFASPVPLSTGGQFIFLTATDGYLYKINADDKVTGNLSKDTRRGSCTADQVIATPTVQLYAYADAAFKANVDSFGGRAGSDVVFVATRTQCGDSTKNRVIAYWATDLVQKWVFNPTGAFKVDYISEGCSLDYGANTLFCGANLQPGATGQNSLFALNSLNGTVRWSTNAGPIQNRPQLADLGGALGKRLYVGNANGAIQVYNPLGASGLGSPYWSSPINMPGPISKNIWIEFRSGPFQGNLLATDAGGTVLQAIRDDNGVATTLWTALPCSGTTFSSMPAVFPSQNRAYIGVSDGRLQQIHLSGGEKQANIVVNDGAGVYDPALDAEGAMDVNRVIAAAAGFAGGDGKIARACVPFANTTTCSGSGGFCTSVANCTALAANWPCKVVTCQGNSCRINSNKANGTACDDANQAGMKAPKGNCTCDAANADGNGNCLTTGANDVCLDGVCVSNRYTMCTCTTVGDRACAPGYTCCGSGGGGCVDLDNDPAHCGGCAINCGTDGTCKKGICSQSTLCSAPTVAQLIAAGVVGATGVAYQRTVGNVCSAYISSYRLNPTVSGLTQVTSTGMVTTYNSNAGDYTPLHGVATPRQGDQVFGSFINNGLTFTPGDGLVKPLGSNVNKVLNASSTGNGTGPFPDARFNYGPIGPAFDYVLYNGTDTTRFLYYGNWTANGNLSKISYNGSAWTAATVATLGARITAIAFEKRKGRTTVFVGYGTTVSLIDVDSAPSPPAQINLNLASASVYTPDGTRGQATVTGIAGIAVHPIYGDVYVEVKGSNNNAYILNIDPNDTTVRDQVDVSVDQHLPAFPTATTLGTSSGRITMTPRMELLRLVPVVNALPTSIIAYVVTPP